jgi:nitrous oxide reductase
MMQHTPPPPVITSELRVVDSAGTPRILLSAAGDGPSIVLIGRGAQPAATIALDKADRPSVKLANPTPGAPVAAIEIDDKGAHVKFDRAGGASSYLFLNNAGTSGVVLIDAKGVRRAALVVSADGEVAVQGADAKATQQP